ncbi:MAG: 30S ribosomal protein S12 methylthiotransferase RimO [Phycisphaerae bacterium]|nr:30S ribosomal protein S12 methylthiotransferase RimO [Phycisphaerae bacterium]MDD5380203.1 30S ribosomal protein S12 methylthiotransferase RimO [Phycisphaerae bacterium]
MRKKKHQKSGQSRGTVGFIALGCPKNMVDSERMLAEIAKAGFLIITEPDPSNVWRADVVVVNTCGFIAPARTEALKAIRHAIKCKRSGTVRKVIVAGCLPQRSGPELFKDANGIDAIVGLGRRDSIAQIIKKTIRSKKPASFLGHLPDEINDDRTRLLITPRHWAYLRISDGCNHRCSFCTVPAIRGPFRSKPKELILDEAAELVSSGAVELNIIAQDTTNYGMDLKIKNGLAELVKEIEKIAGLSWIRLMYLYPGRITDQLIETVAESKKIVHYFDIPIQHINDKILKDMRRPDTKERICRLIEKLRANMPDAVLRTTLIVGFPGETDLEFNELLDFVKSAEFDALGAFKYYPESGTDAAEMPGQVPDRVKRQRLKELMLTQQKIAFAKNKNRIGSKLTCLVDSVKAKGAAKGRFYGQAPDIDSVCFIKSCSASLGRFIETKVIGTKNYDLVVEQI